MRTPPVKLPIQYRLGVTLVATPILLSYVDVGLNGLLFLVAVIAWSIGIMLLLFFVMTGRANCLVEGIIPLLEVLLLAGLAEVFCFYCMVQSRIAAGFVLLAVVVCWTLICRRAVDGNTYIICGSPLCIAIFSVPVLLAARDLRVLWVDAFAEAAPVRIAFAVVVALTLTLAVTRHVIRQTGIALSAFIVGCSFHSPMAKLLFNRQLLDPMVNDYANGDSTVTYVWVLSLGAIPLAIVVGVVGLQSFLCAKEGLPGAGGQQPGGLGRDGAPGERSDSPSIRR